MIRVSPETNNLKNLLENLKKEAAKISETLIENYSGLEINSEGRIIGEEPKEASEKITIQQQKPQILGELLELTKFVKVNFENSDLITIRTSLYDDFCNHVDEIIYDKKTLQPLMAIDITTTSQKEIQLNKLTRLIKMINQGGGQVKYGFIAKKEAEKISFQKQTLEHIPVFIVHMMAEELLDILQGRKFDFSNWLKDLIKDQTEHIIKIIDEQWNIAQGEHRHKLESLRNKYRSFREQF